MSLLKSIGMVFGRLFWGEVWSEIIRVARVFWREEEGREIGGGDRKGRRLRRRVGGGLGRMRTRVACYEIAIAVWTWLRLSAWAACYALAIAVWSWLRLSALVWTMGRMLFS